MKQKLLLIAGLLETESLMNRLLDGHSKLLLIPLDSIWSWPQFLNSMMMLKM